jgi:hypothetical protein
MQNPSFRERLLGTWRLVSCVQRDEQGRESYPFGEDADGFLVYTADGFVSAHLEQRNRPRHQSPDFTAGTPDEYKTMGQGYLAYCGRYALDEETRRLAHTMTVSLFPNWLGSTQVRVASFEGDRLILRTEVPILVDEKMQTGELVWRRASEVRE